MFTGNQQNSINTLVLFFGALVHGEQYFTPNSDKCLELQTSTDKLFIRGLWGNLRYGRKVTNVADPDPVPFCPLDP
jgi:hypothetical protein